MKNVLLEVVRRNLNNTFALAVPLDFAAMYLAVESLVGDKILELAGGSPGIPPERGADIAKRVYELNVPTSQPAFQNPAGNSRITRTTRIISSSSRNNKVTVCCCNRCPRFLVCHGFGFLEQLVSFEFD